MKANKKMNFIRWLCVVLIFMAPLAQGYAQVAKSVVDDFFTNEKILTIQMKADFHELRKNRTMDQYRKASLSILSDASGLNDIAIEVKPRGVSRLELCNPPPLMVNFKSNKKSPLYALGKLKLVQSCEPDNASDQLIIKEYLVYQLYQILTPISFRVRLVHLEMNSLTGEPYSKARYGFFIENVDDLALRNGCREMPETERNTESLNREDNTMLSIFQFMIGNTDWSVPLNRNVKILQANIENFKPPFAVPYDFDYAGLVNAPYALPFEELQIQHVTERLYRGYERTYEELEKALATFRTKKPELYGVIQSCTLLTKSNMQEMVSYLDSFFQIIDNKNKVKDLFIHNARKQ